MNLQERTCACGCGRKFSVLEESAHVYASLFCADPKRKFFEVPKSVRHVTKRDAAPGLVSAATLATELGVGVSTVYMWAKAEKIPFQKEGRGPRFDVAAVRKALENSPPFS